MKKPYLVFALLALAPLLPLRADDGNDILVCENSIYKRIQDGVNAARPGGRVHVCAGTYAEQVTISTDGVNVAADGKVYLIEPTPAKPYGFRVTARDVQIQGFTISGFKDQTLSAGILLDHAVNASVTHNLIYGNCNGVLMNLASNATLAHNNLSQNPFPDSPQPQKGIPSPPPGQTNSCVVYSFDPNTQMAIVSPDGYGVKSSGGSEQTIDHNRVSQNGECGIQLSGDSAGAKISNNTLYLNTGPQFTPCGNIDLRSVSGARESIDVADNQIDTGTNGIMLTSSDHVVVEGNHVVRNFQGIQLVSSSYNSFSNNIADHNTTGIFLTGQFNDFDRNNVNSNDSQGIVVFVDGCPDACSSRAGQGFHNTWANSFTGNSIENNAGGDVFDFSSLSGTQCPMDPTCDPNPAGPPPPPPHAPPGNYTPGTLDFWSHNDCNTGTPSSVCSN